MSPPLTPCSKYQTSAAPIASTSSVSTSAIVRRASRRRWRSPHVDKRRSSSVITGRVSPPARTPRIALTNRALRTITRIVNAAELPAPQLGRILIAAGLLSEEQLAQALEEQEQTGRRLGEIIVQRGFISGPALANALAEQHGGVLKTEYGFASGLGGVVARRAAAESGTLVSPLRPPEPTPMPTLRTAEPEPVSLAPEEEQAPSASEELAQPPLQQEAPEALTPPEPPGRTPGRRGRPRGGARARRVPGRPPPPPPPPRRGAGGRSRPRGGGPPPVPEPAHEAEPVVPDPVPTPPAEAAEPVPEPVDLSGSQEPEPEQPAAAGLDERDELIESLRTRVEAQELELAKLREQLEQERSRTDVQVHVWQEEQPVPTTPGPG